jgi:SAM-dependent methyltransferase
VVSATNLPPDRLAHREWLVSHATLREGGVGVDLGCGRGEDLRLLAARLTAPDVRLVGVDASETSIETARVANAADTRLSFQRAALDGALPFADASFDLVYSHNLLECLAAPDLFAREVARVLRPGGRVVIGHWDWESQLFDGFDRARVRRLVAAFADWQQAWMAHADGWMGRRLWGVFNATSSFDGVVAARVLTNTVFDAPFLGYENAHAMRSLAKRGLVEASDVDDFLREQQQLHEQGRYFYSITGFAYVGSRLRS